MPDSRPALVLELIYGRNGLVTREKHTGGGIRGLPIREGKPEPIPLGKESFAGIGAFHDRRVELAHPLHIELQEGHQIPEIDVVWELDLVELQRLVPLDFPEILIGVFLDLDRSQKLRKE